MKQTSFSNKPRKCDVGCVCPDQCFTVSLYQNSLSAAWCCCRPDYVSQWSGQYVQQHFY